MYIKGLTPEEFCSVWHLEHGKHSIEFQLRLDAICERVDFKDYIETRINLRSGNVARSVSRLIEDVHEIGLELYTVVY